MVDKVQYAPELDGSTTSYQLIYCVNLQFGEWYKGMKYHVSAFCVLNCIGSSKILNEKAGRLNGN